MQENKQTLWIISELFPPEETSTGYIMGEIANAMTSKFTVKVICGPEVYDARKKTESKSPFILKDGIEVIRVKGVNENKQSKISRIKKFLLMSWRLYRVAKKQVKKGDKVLMVTNPFPLIVLMAYLRRHRQIELSMLVHDIFPEGMFTDLYLPGQVYSISEKVFNRAYSSVDRLISIGRDMTEVLQRKCFGYRHQPEIVLIENWGDVVNIQPKEKNLDEKIVIQYAGNIGNAQGVGDFVELLHNVKNDQLEFGIWGTGSAEESIKQTVKEYGMEEKVKFNGPYLRSQQIEVLNDCDIALVRLVEGMYGLGVPSKSYNILAAGKPILYIGERNTEVWRMVEENGIGYCFEPKDRESLRSLLDIMKPETFREELRQKGRRASALAEKKYAKEVILKKFTETL